jgi:hypothetical protein
LRVTPAKAGPSRHVNSETPLRAPADFLGERGERHRFDLVVEPGGHALLFRERSAGAAPAT